MIVAILASGVRAGYGDEARKPEAPLRAGAYAIDVSPRSFPVLVNGGFLQASASRVNDPLYARCLVMESGAARLAIVVVDSCMMPRELLDRAKELVRAKTGIPPDRMLISATHTHSAPAAMGALGCSADAAYVAFLPERIAEGIAQAVANLVPARAGWAAIDDDRHTFCRRWIRRPDRMLDDPFGNRSVRANMHPGHQNPDAIGPSGPVDPALTVLSIKSRAGRPIAVLANYSQHYFGAPPVSADYYGRFSTALARRLGAEQGEEPGKPPFVGIMSQGTSGDQMWMDYGSPRIDPGLDRYADELAESAQRACATIAAYHDAIPLAMAEAQITLRRRVPDEARLRWAKPIVTKLGERPPRDLPEVYAREAIFLHQEPERTLKLQALRIGDLGIAAIPNEVFALTGLKIKSRSPLPLTMNISLANGSEGYIPPPEQHALGGYTTWPARTAALEVQAEPRIVLTVLDLLETVADRPRRISAPALTAYTQHVLASRPLAYWRLEEMEGALAGDATGHEHVARFVNEVAFYLAGPDGSGLKAGAGINRAPHLAGGKIVASMGTPLPAESYSIEFWFWNGLPTDARPVTAYLFACARAAGPSEILGLGGTAHPAEMGRLFVAGAHPASTLNGKKQIPPKSWHHVVLTRAGRHISVYLDGSPDPELAGELDAGAAAGPESGSTTLFLGGRHDRESTLEGKLDEAALYDRPLSPIEVVEHFRAAMVPGAAPKP